MTQEIEEEAPRYYFKLVIDPDEISANEKSDEKHLPTGKEEWQNTKFNLK